MREARTPGPSSPIRHSAGLSTGAQPASLGGQTRQSRVLQVEAEAPCSSPGSPECQAHFTRTTPRYSWPCLGCDTPCFSTFQVTSRLFRRGQETWLLCSPHPPAGSRFTKLGSQVPPLRCLMLLWSPKGDSHPTRLTAQESGSQELSSQSPGPERLGQTGSSLREQR